MRRCAKRFAAFLLAVGAVLSTGPALAFTDTSHMIAAEGAYQELSRSEAGRKVRDQIVAILRKATDDLGNDRSPSFDKDSGLAALRAAWEKADATLSDGHALFLVAAIWPDAIRRSKTRYDHGEYHYIDIPYERNGGKAPAAQNPINPDGTVRENNAVYWFNAQMDVVGKALKKKAADCDAGDAAAVCWVLHLAGDLHQPLHAVSLYDGGVKKFKYFKLDANKRQDVEQWADLGAEGDRGGNLFFVEEPKSSAAKQLHRRWDDWASFATPPLENAETQFPSRLKIAVDEAEKMRATAVSANKAKVLDPLKWALESNELAKTVAYAGIAPFTGVPPGEKEPTGIAPDAKYDETMVSTCRQQLALAGHRLAGAIEAAGKP